MGPTFKVPAAVNSLENAAYFQLGNTSPISLITGQTYFYAASVRLNPVNPAGAVVFPGSDANGVDKCPGHLNLVTTASVVTRMKESLDLSFSLTFEE
jgi:hypothetical protein